MLLSRRPKPPAVPRDRSGEALQAIGQELRDARIARGEDLHDIAAFLRIRPAYLVALEGGELGALPGRPYAAGFLRCYGAHLGLDGDALVARLKPAVAGMAALPREISRREPPSESRRPTAAVVTASLVLAGALYAGYHLFSADREPPAQQVAELAAGVPPPATPPAQSIETAAPTTTAAEMPAAPTAAVRDEDAPPTPPAETVPPVAADVTSAVAAESGSSDGAAAGAPAVLAALDGDGAAPTTAAAAGRDEVGRVVLVARGTSWIQVRSADRAYVRTRTLQPGDRFAVPERPDLTLSTGNAGGLEVLVDGESVGPVGASGAVVRNLPLVPEALKLRPVAVR
jgi:cytoskeleton protein RodZ